MTTKKDLTYDEILKKAKLKDTAVRTIDDCLEALFQKGGHPEPYRTATEIILMSKGDPLKFYSLTKKVMWEDCQVDIDSM